MKSFVAIAIALFSSQATFAQENAPLPVAAAKQTAQAQFDALVVFIDEKKWNEALTAADALKARVMAMKSPNPTVVASIDLLAARALRETQQISKALGLVNKVIDSGAFDAVTMQSEKYEALMLAGNLEEILLTLDVASLRYSAAAAIASGDAAKVEALAATSRASVTINPARSLTTVDAALVLVPDTKENNATRAALANLKGRALLNAGRHEDALAILGDAVKKLGGLTVRVTRSDISARADAALAAFLANKPAKARELLAYTGAGNFEGQEFEIGNDMRPPQCGGLAGLRPDDVAVIEFSVRDDGSVADPTPIYTNRPGLMGLAFANAVAQWWWAPEKAKAMNAFFRIGTRLQMRCTNTLDRPQTAVMLTGEYRAWLSKIAADAPPVVGKNRLEASAALSTLLAQREAADGPTAITLLPIIDALISDGALPNEQSRALSTRAIAIAAAAGAPDVAFNHLLLRDAQYDRLDGRNWKDSARDTAVRLTALTSRPTFVRDQRSRIVLDLAIAQRKDALREFDQSLALLRGAATRSETLADGDPVKVAALIQLASAEQAATNAAAASAAFLKSGLSAKQCALADSKPAQIGGSVSDSDFPREAMMWGFSGWVVSEYDISAAGQSVNVRPLIAYPPYVFAGAASTMVSRFRYRETFRPDGSLGCGANSQRISFRSAQY